MNELPWGGTGQGRPGAQGGTGQVVHALSLRIAMEGQACPNGQQLQQCVSTGSVRYGALQDRQTSMQAPYSIPSANIEAPPMGTCVSPAAAIEDMLATDCRAVQQKVCERKCGRVKGLKARSVMQFLCSAHACCGHACARQPQQPQYTALGAEQLACRAMPSHPAKASCPWQRPTCLVMKAGQVASVVSQISAMAAWTSRLRWAQPI